MAEYTLPTSKLPEGTLPPTLLFHRWHGYDSFSPGRSEFKREKAMPDFLGQVAKETQRTNKEHYASWHALFTKACEGLGAAEPFEVTTLWRLAVGWGTNPALEVGITLDHFLGFPYIPGSAVKGMLHRVAEQELMELPEPWEPPGSGELPQNPCEGLLDATWRARLVRAVFGSLHLRKGGEGQPEAPFDLLTDWKKILDKRRDEEISTPWSHVRRDLAELLSDAATGGMVTCYDAVPSPRVFKAERQLLCLDVLTPHTGDSPNPILFLAVRDGAEFEIRYRLAPWPAEKPRDEPEIERAAALDGLSREQVEAQIRRWLGRAVTELGAGGKTTAGYGYFLAPGHSLAEVTLLEPPAENKPADPRSDAERYAARELPEDIDRTKVTNILEDALEGALGTSDPAEKEKHRAVVRLFNERFPEMIKKWRSSPAKKKKERVQRLDQVLEEDLP